MDSISFGGTIWKRIRNMLAGFGLKYLFTGFSGKGLNPKSP
jgi:hypothetical protein